MMKKYAGLLVVVFALAVAPAVSAEPAGWGTQWWENELDGSDQSQNPDSGGYSPDAPDYQDGTSSGTTGPQASQSGYAVGQDASIMQSIKTQVEKRVCNCFRSQTVSSQYSSAFSSSGAVQSAQTLRSSDDGLRQQSQAQTQGETTFAGMQQNVTSQQRRGSGKDRKESMISGSSSASSTGTNANAGLEQTVQIFGITVPDQFQ